jgi:hypothetical protein
MSQQEHFVQFEIDPNLFGDALSEVSQNLVLSDGTLFACAIDGADSDLFHQQSCVPQQAVTSGEETGQRLVLGLEGKSRSYTFVDMPVREVTHEGMFVLGRVGELTTWADEAESYTTITYSATATDNSLRIDYPDGHDEIDIKLLYTGDDFERYFDCHQERFTKPSTSVYSEELGEMLALGKKIAPSGDRTGDLVFEDGTAEFLTRQRLERMVVATSQKCDLPEGYPLAGFEWEVDSDQLAHLKRTVGNESATAEVREETNSRTDTAYHVLQMAYKTEAGAGETLHVDHKTTAFRENPPIKDWAGREEIFGSDFCKLFSTVQSEKLTRRLNTTWALKPNKVVCAEPSEDEDGAPVLDLHTYTGSGEDTDRKTVPITPGDSEVERYLFMPGAQSVIEKIIGGAQLTQIRSFPARGEERPNGYVVVPLEEETDADQDVIDPKRYVIATWQEQ